MEAAAAATTAAAATSTTKNISWNKGDDAKLLDLFKRGIAKTHHTKKDEIDPFRKKYFDHIVYRNFRTKYLKKAAEYITDNTKRGANIPAAGECLYYLFLWFAAIYYRS